MIHQEQHRIELFRDTVLSRFLETEMYVERIIDALKTLKIVDDDVDATYWKTSVSCIMYALANRLALRRWKDSDFTPRISLEGIFRDLFDSLLKLHGCK
jgi:hypothetical protein